MTKRASLAAVLAPLALFLIAATQVWVSGTTTDAVLGGATVTLTGAQAVPAAIALGLVVGAALLALLTGGTGIRYAAIVALVLAGLGALWVTVPVVLDPAAALGRRAAEIAGRTGTVRASAAVGPWAWLALACLVVLVAAALATSLSSRTWQGLSARFDRPAEGERASDQAEVRGAIVTAERPAPGVERPAAERGTRRTAWDDLTEGHDPTAGHDATEGESGPTMPAAT